MGVPVEIPQPVVLAGDETLTLMCDEASGAQVVVHADGVVEWRGNGGGAPRFTLDLPQIAEVIRQNVRDIGRQE